MIKLKNIEKHYKKITNIINKFTENEEIKKYFSITVDDADYMEYGYLTLILKGNNISCEISYSSSENTFSIIDEDNAEEYSYSENEITKKMQEFAISAAIIGDIKKQYPKKIDKITINTNLVNKDEYDVCCGATIIAKDGEINISCCEDKVIISTGDENDVNVINLSNPSAFKQIKENIDRLLTPIDDAFMEKIASLANIRMHKEDIKIINTIYNKYCKD